MIAGLTALALTGATPCALPPGWPAIEARHTRYVIFGEVHGTAQSPAMVGNIACGLAAKRERLLVAVELAADENSALQAAWSGPKQDFATTIDRTMPNWRSRNDGVTSKAMHAMLVRLHDLKAAGAAIDVVAFNSGMTPARFRDLPGQGPHEAGQAENIRRAADAGRYDHVLILVGNFHARKKPIEDGEIFYEPMAMRLAPPDRITSLDMAFSSGMMWNCLLRPGIDLAPGTPVPSDAIDCGSHSTRGSGGADGSPHLALGAAKGEGTADSYDGYYWVGAIDGSPPYSKRGGQ